MIKMERCLKNDEGENEILTHLSLLTQNFNEVKLIKAQQYNEFIFNFSIIN